MNKKKKKSSEKLMRYAYLLPLLVFGALVPNAANSEYCPPGNTLEQMSYCASSRLEESDYYLKQKLDNDELFEKWRNSRDAICDHVTKERFNGGSLRPMMTEGCRERLNSEAQRFCLTGDPQCG